MTMANCRSQSFTSISCNGYIGVLCGVFFEGAGLAGVLGFVYIYIYI